MNKANTKANIDYEVQGIRGGQPHKKKNVGAITTHLESGVSIQCEAFTTSLDTQERTRRDNTLVTIKKDDDIVFCETPLMLVDIIKEYYGG